MKPLHPCLLATALCIGALPVMAQIEPGTPGSGQTIPEKDRSRPQDMPKPDGSENDVPSGRSSSDASKQYDGVIEPPKGIDPEIVEPAPSTPSQMPVIRPPGTPGGPPGVVPK
jgi:hypothetical protein